MNAKDKEAVDRFRRDVLEASLGGVVLVRFTAEWCGPCKQLAPVIDRAIAAVGDRRVSQVVIDIDQDRLLAEEFRIQSVPTVYAFLGGRPVDGFVGVKGEREIRAMIEKLLSALPPDAAEAVLDAMVAAAADALAGGDAELAAEAFGALLREHPDRADIAGHYARALLALGQVEGAQAALSAVPADSREPVVQQARAALELARSAPAAGELAEVEARLQADPSDHQARFDRASAHLARGNRDAAADDLLAIVSAERDWNDGKARETLLKLIESVGLADPWSIATRKRLRQILFA
ncbi:MAG: tetratricopeptide repeat protein [Sphingomonadaceae bacterium]